MKLIQYLGVATTLTIGVAALPSGTADPVTGVSIADFTYSNFPTGTEGIIESILQSTHFYDDYPSLNIEWSYSINRTLNVITGFNQPSVQKYRNSQGFTIEATIPAIVQDSSGEYEWGSEGIIQQTPTATTAIPIATSTGGTLTPSTGVDCQSTYYTGSGTFSYTSTVTITRSSGATQSFPEAGTLSLNTLSNGDTTCVADNSS